MKRGVRATEKDILEQVYRRYYKEALLYCMALCGSMETAEDLVADAFVKAYLSLPGEVPSFRYWLFRVCKNLWIDQLRKEKRLAEKEAAGKKDFAAEQNTPEKNFFKSEERRCLWEAIRSLMPEDREMVVLYWFSGVPLHEIAALQGKSYGAVRQRMHRVKEVLKKRMEEQGYEF